MKKKKKKKKKGFTAKLPSKANDFATFLVGERDFLLSSTLKCKEGFEPDFFYCLTILTINLFFGRNVFSEVFVQ
jgi:hypothetical protein